MMVITTQLHVSRVTSAGVPNDQITNAQAPTLELHVIDVNTRVHACIIHHPHACMHGLIILDEGTFFSSKTSHAR
jgi:hypothetical protein